MWYRYEIAMLEAQRDVLIEANKEVYSLMYDLDKVSETYSKAKSGDAESTAIMTKLYRLLTQLQDITVNMANVHAKERERKNQKKANHFHQNNYYNFRLT